MSIAKNKTKAIDILMILILAASATLVFVPIGNAQTSLNVSTVFYDEIGQNSPTEITWVLSPNILSTDPSYVGAASIWNNAVITFTRPDSTTDVVNGPIPVSPQVIGGAAPRLQLIYTPNMMGNWSVNLYWPGDSTYASVNTTATFIVYGHFPKRTSWAYLSIRPYPTVGLGQDILVNAWVCPAPWTNYDNYKDYVFTFKRPDGTSFTVGPMDSEGPGVVWFNLPLDQLGNWSITMDFPGDHGTLPCSVTRAITVQQDWIPTYPDTPLPTEPWTFPINVENREWRTIAGEWLESYYSDDGRASWNPYTEGPRTAHILWKLPAYSGIGGFVGSPHSIETGGGEEVYEGGDVGIFTSSCPNIRTVMAGRGYYTAGGMIHCVDMRTGEELWSVEGSFSAGATRSRVPVLYYFSSSRFMAYNGLDGSLILDVPGMSKTFFIDPYVYTRSGSRLIKWTTAGTSSNFASRIIWNISDITPVGRYETIVGDIWFGRGNTPRPPTCVIYNHMVGINVTTGETVFDIWPTFDYADPDKWIYGEGPALGGSYGVVYWPGGTTRVEDGPGSQGWMAVNATTGQVAWISEMTDYPWGVFWAYMPYGVGYGTIFGLSYDGVYAFNVTNGDIIWHYVDEDTYFEEPYASNINATDGSPYASYSFGSTGPVIGGGLVFAPNTEHSPTLYYRGQGMTAIDAFTGEKVWRIIGIYVPTAIAYGTLLAYDSANGYTYAFAKGETETTVSVQNDVYAKGDSVLLKGTVLDMSSAQPGTAAVADKDQEAWMEYLHMQQPFPISASGVSVSLDALDPNNNYVHLGDATTDLTGQYRLLWEPELEGQYTVIASFYSTDAYYGSTAETGIGVTAGPAATAEPTPAPASNTDMYILSIGIAALVLIAVVGLVIILTLRKR